MQRNLCLTGAYGPRRYWPRVGRNEPGGMIKVFSGNYSSGPSVSWSISNDEIAQQKNGPRTFPWTFVLALDPWAFVLALDFCLGFCFGLGFLLGRLFWPWTFSWACFLAWTFWRIFGLFLGLFFWLGLFHGLFLGLVFGLDFSLDFFCWLGLFLGLLFWGVHFSSMFWPTFPLCFGGRNMMSS